jgi:predicted amidohydrolase
MLKLSLVQFTPVMGDPDYNLEQISSMLKDIKTDIIVMPELCTTGYFFLTGEEAFEAAEGPDGQTVAFFKQLATGHRALVVAGFAERSDNMVYNSAIITAPGIDVKIYRKTHLFFREKECFSEGNSGFFVVQHPLKDCKVGVMICNDGVIPKPREVWLCSEPI